MPDHLDNHLLASLHPHALALVSREMRQGLLDHGAVLFEPGQAVDRVYFPQSALVSLMVVTKDGGTIETALIGREGAVGLHCGLGTRRSFTRAVAQVGGMVSSIRAARFQQIVRDNPPIRDVIERYTEVLWAEAQQCAACNAMHDASCRLCRCILQSADRTGSEDLPLTQEFLARMLGIQRTTVTLLAQSIQKKGLISYSRGHMVILDRQGLAASACECYRVMQHSRLPLMLGVKL